MPATMMHLLAAKLLWPEGSTPFFLGSILPDCLDCDREWKDRVHFRSIPQEERLAALITLAKELDLDRDFDFGALFHLYLDYLWDNGPQSAHRKSYTGSAWFVDYRKELSRAGNRVAQRMPWSRELWESLRDPDPSLYENSFHFPEEEIRIFLEKNYLWHTTERLPASEIFTDQLVDHFSQRAKRAFVGFLCDFFPEVAKKRRLS